MRREEAAIGYRATAFSSLTITLTKHEESSTMTTLVRTAIRHSRWATRGARWLRDHLRRRRVARGPDETTHSPAPPPRLPLGRLAPHEVSRRNLDLVMSALERAGLPAFLVRTDDVSRHTVGLYEEHRARALEVLADDLVESVRVKALQVGQPGLPPRPADALRSDEVVRTANVLRFAQFYASEDGGYRLGLDHGCDLEFWRPDPEHPAARRAPRGNVAANVVAERHLAAVDTEVGGRAYPTARVFARRFTQDIDFPVDAVYAWVDGDDPAWQARKAQVLAARGGHPGAGPDERADHAVRFRSRDELRYSLRSVHMFAPWIRNIFIITDDQVPDWLDTDAPRIEVVSHRELFEGASLPTFNSNVISSYLHRIAGLSEQFLYFNDDVMLGRPLKPQLFFTPAGQTRAFLSDVSRPFLDHDPDLPPALHVAENIRRALEREFGITTSRATRHTPIALVRSELAHLEERFAEEYAATRANQFRDPTDIAADILFQHYAQIVGCGVAGAIDFTYVNLGKAEHEKRLGPLLADRAMDVFCLNDTLGTDAGPIPGDRVQRFMQSYFPTPSPWER